MSKNSKSPLNNLFGRLAGIDAAKAVFGGGGKGKVKQRVKKLENQVRSLNQMMRDGGEDQGPVFQTGATGDFGENVIQQENEMLNPTFDPGAMQAGEQMFGSKIPGSFDRDMGEEIY